MSELSFVFPPENIVKQAHVSPAQYSQLYRQSLEDPESFWRQQSQHLEWFTPFSQVFQWDFPHYQWFQGGKLNITHNCLDRHVREGKGEKVAYYWAGEAGETSSITYAELLTRVQKMANVLRGLGVEQGDRVAIYMPLIIEQVIAMLACARLGAIHTVIFAGFSAPALRLRLEDTAAKVLISGTWTRRRGKKIDLLSIARTAVDQLPTLQHHLVFSREEEAVSLQNNETLWQGRESAASAICPAEPMDSEAPLFILYTSGTTGKPKGIVHSTAGYNLYTHLTTQYVFDLHEDDRYWCTADPGWITGHSYGVYGPLSVGVTSVIAEGAPDYPTPDRWWEIIETLQVNVFYTAPTAVRLLMKYGQHLPHQHDLSSLKIIGSVGEPINPAAWYWLYEHVGRNQAAIVDTWWQTETGGHLLVTLPSLPQQPGKAGLPFLGVEPILLDEHDQPVKRGEKGRLFWKSPWPSALRTCWNNDERFQQYWTETNQPLYSAGDFAIQDEQGYFQVLGRSDDVLNVAGHRLGTAEVESALVAHPAVAEAAVIAVPDDLTGEHLVAHVILTQENQPSESLQQELIEQVKQEIGRFASIHTLHFLPALPKTRSGKIMRRLLRAQALGEELGDTSTLEQ